MRDESACEGCATFECVKACPKKPEGVEIFNCQHCHCVEAACGKGFCAYGARAKSKDGGIAKCDLCPGRSVPLCVSACKKSALRVDRDFLGWRVLPPLAGEYAVEDCGFGFSSAEERVLELLLSRLRERALPLQAEKECPGRGVLFELLRGVCGESGFALEKSRAAAVLKAAEMNSSGFGVLDLLLKDDELEEISVVGAGRKIYVFHKAKGWLSSNCFFASEDAAVNAINKMARPLGRRVTFQSPRLNAALEDGSTRIHAAIPPLSKSGVEITLRRFSKNPLSVAELVSFGTIDCKSAAFLWLALQADVSMIVAGNTGSGKTSTLNALLSFVPLNERLVLVEETPELRLLHKHCVRLVANEELGISMKELVKDTLRMRPDRVVVGEVRGKEEVEALFDSVLAGQARGTYATMHAKTACDALSRLQSFGISESDLAAIDLMVVQRRIPIYDSKNKRQLELRRVTEIAEVASGKAALLYKHDAFKDKLVECGKSALLKRLCANYKSTPAQIAAELKKREEFLRNAGREKAGCELFAQEVQKYLFEK